MEFGSSKAKLLTILETSLANRRAARDLTGIVGVKGSFTFNAAGTAVTAVVGTGFNVEAVSGTAGAFRVYLERRPTNVLGAKALAFVSKAIGAASDTFTVDVSGWDMDATVPYITFRCVAKTAPHAVMAPGAICTVCFEINCTYSSETGY